MKESEYFVLKGFSVANKDAWNKLRTGQFGGSPGRGAGELIQNAIDSYDPSVPMADRRIEINAGRDKYVITDWGSGFTPEKLILLVTFGGTDKSDDPSKIGQFGIGFFSIFHKALKTRSVTVETRIGKDYMVIRFCVKVPGELPELTLERIPYQFEFSTRITVRFGLEDYPAEQCLWYTLKTAANFPCHMVINGKLFETIWQEAARKRLQHFENSESHGFFDPKGSNWITVFCKYERILHTSLVSLLTGKFSYYSDLSGFSGYPYIPGLETVINCNTLNLTISRDGYYLDDVHYRMISFIKEQLFVRLSRMKMEGNDQLVLANLYTLRHDVAGYLQNGFINTVPSVAHQKVIETLAALPVFRISGKKELFSIAGLREMRTPDIPLFFSPNRSNLMYLGGNFKHDFIVLPDPCELEGGAPHFYQTLFETVFQDIVNLDTLQGNQDLVQRLVGRGIIAPEALVPLVAFVGEKQLSRNESAFLSEVNALLRNKEIIYALEKNLFLSVKSIRPLFFEIREEGAYIMTGFFDGTLHPVTDDYITNFSRKGDDESPLLESQELILGLRKDHPLVEQLLVSRDRHRVYYALTYIANELTASQKLLVPSSSFFHIKKEFLARDMRNALIEALICEVN